MVLQYVIPMPASDASASFDFEDIEEGLGFVTFNCATTSGSRIMTRSLPYSTDISTIDASLAGNHTKEIDIDFDTSTFNLPRVAKGTALVNVPFAIQTAGGGGRAEGYTVADIKHWDGTTETSIGRSTSGAQWISPIGAGTIFSGSQLHKIALTQKVFKKGDTLRLTVEGWSVSSNGSMEVGHDPQNRNAASTNLLTSGPTKMILDIPFKLDL